jgi:hypothetical protein
MSTYLFKLQDVSILILYVIDSILYFLMCRSNQPLAHHGLSSLGISGQLFKLLLGGISLHYFELPLYVILHDILELGLDLLGLPEDIPELGC